MREDGGGRLVLQFAKNPAAFINYRGGVCLLCGRALSSNGSSWYDRSLWSHHLL